MGQHASALVQKGKLQDFYEKKERIGTGTFATVRRVVRKKDQTEFACKILDKRNLSRKDLEGLHDEIQILKSMDHPNVIKMIDVFDHGKRVYIVLELCLGGDLFDQLHRQPDEHLTEGQAANIIKQIAGGIRYLHSRGVVHRDLKPENILFDVDNPDGCLKITDFGLAHHLEETDDTLTVEHLMHTCCGTPRYVAPEVIGTSQYGPECDMWSLGVILYVMLCGFQPFQCNTINQMYRLIIKGKYDFPSPYWDNISDDAKKVIRGLMCRDPGKRYTSETLLEDPWVNQRSKSSKNILPSSFRIQLVRTKTQRRKMKSMLLLKKSKSEGAQPETPPDSEDGGDFDDYDDLNLQPQSAISLSGVDSSDDLTTSTTFVDYEAKDEELEERVAKSGHKVTFGPERSTTV